MAEKLFRDPLHDYIAIDKKDSWLLRLVNCPEVQRLRYISQLGLSQFTYPGATHSRFSHSLGVMYLMKECLSHLLTDFQTYFKQLDREALLAAALLHDIGHGPFSHATEGIFGNHEQQTVQIINDTESEVHKILSSRAPSLPAKTASLIAEKSVAPSWQKSLISSQLDMDRLDYLRRDSLYSGAEYGHFDCSRIIRTMQLQEREMPDEKKEMFIVWPDKSKYALEEYLFSRFYMYQSVYFHHTTRIFETLLQKILGCAQVTALENKAFAKTLLPPMKILLGGNTNECSTRFLGLTDDTVLAQLRIWQSNRNKTICDLVNRLLLRTGFAWQEIRQKTSFEITEKVNAVRSYLNKQRLNPQYYFFEDNTQAIAYKPYRPASEIEDQSSTNSIILYESSWGGTRFREISDVPGLERIKAITATKAFPLTRYYFPREHETKIKKLLT